MQFRTNNKEIDNQHEFFIFKWNCFITCIHNLRDQLKFIEQYKPNTEFYFEQTISTNGFAFCGPSPNWAFVYCAHTNKKTETIWLLSWCMVFTLPQSSHNWMTFTLVHPIQTKPELVALVHKPSCTLHSTAGTFSECSCNYTQDWLCVLAYWYVSEHANATTLVPNAAL